MIQGVGAACGMAASATLLVSPRHSKARFSLRVGLPLQSLNADRIDLAIDGADEWIILN